MNKFTKFILIVCCITVISCECNTYNSSPVVTSESSEKVIIKDDYNDFVYTKIVIENHEYYFRSWAADGQYYGSNLVHNPNCSTCNNKKNI